MLLLSLALVLEILLIIKCILSCLFSEVVELGAKWVGFVRSAGIPPRLLHASEAPLVSGCGPSLPAPELMAMIRLSA